MPALWLVETHMKNKNKKRLCPLLLLFMCSGAAAASGGCGGSSDDSEFSRVEVEVSALTGNSVALLADCTVDYIMDVELTAEQKEMDVRKAVENAAPSVVGGFIYQQLQEEPDLLGRAFTEDLPRSIESIPGYEGCCVFDVSCGAVRLANPAPADAGR
jgi:hypothetical protein